jgi:hypothetical protein
MARNLTPSATNLLLRLREHFYGPPDQLIWSYKSDTSLGDVDPKLQRDLLKYYLHREK